MMLPTTVPSAERWPSAAARDQHSIGRPQQQKHANRQEAARETLTLDPDGAEIALLGARFYFDGTRAGREGVRQTKDHLRKVGADYGPDVFRRKIVSFVITPGQINYDGGRGFALY